MRDRIKTDRTATAILTADIHLRDDTPACRTDDFLAARARKVAWLRDLQDKHDDCPIIDAGDMFNKWQVSSELEGWALINLPNGIITVPGNHDLPNHNLKLYKKSSLHVLEAAGKVKVLSGDSPGMRGIVINEMSIIGYPYGDQLDLTITTPLSTPRIAIVHAYVAETIPVFIEGYTPAQLLAALPGYDLIVSGHNHESLDYVVTDRKGNKRLVVNPGGMMRMSADQADIRPGVYLWYADTNEVKRLDYPIESGVVSREHLEKVEERDARMEAFVSRLDNSGVEVGLSFERNVEQYLVTNKIKKETRDMVREAIK